MATIELEPRLRIRIYSHFFSVRDLTGSNSGILLKFCAKYVHYGFSQGQGKTPFKIYATKTNDNKEFRFHVGQLKHFYQYLLNLGFLKEQLDIEYADMYEAATIPAKVKPEWSPREGQEEVIEFMVADDISDHKSRLATVRTGGGKTVMSLMAIARLGKRTLVLVLPKYIEKWCGDITDVLDTPSKNIMVIQGSDSLRGMISLAKEGQFKSDFVVISLTTFNNFLKAYSEDPWITKHEDYGCTPEEMYELLGIGTVLIDEVHEHLHAVFRSMLYMNVHKLLALSATYLSDDRFVEEMQKIMFPKEIRYDKGALKKYIHVYAYSYYFKDFQGSKIKTSDRGSGTYSQTAFEKSILNNKKPHIKENYLDLIGFIADVTWKDKYLPGDKMLVFAGTVDMCKELVSKFQMKYPDKTVNKYTQGDPYENVINSDITVSTIGSAGTALDIPDLRATIMTNNIRSSVSNIQTLGRLRELKDRDVSFAYLYSENIPKQIQYHMEKKDLFRDRVASIKEFRAPMSV